LAPHKDLPTLNNFRNCENAKSCFKKQNYLTCTMKCAILEFNFAVELHGSLAL
jgi:hypothetical protein